MADPDSTARFVIAVEDVNGAWASVQSVLQSRLPFKNLSLPNKFGNRLQIDELPVQFVLSTDPQLQRLRPYSQSPVTWFRNPFATLIVLRCEDVEEYRRTLKLQLRSLTDSPAAKDPVTGAGEWVMLLVRQPGLDPATRAPRKLFELLRWDFGKYALRANAVRERAARLHLPAGSASTPALVAELEAVECQLKTCITASFEARAAAYEDEVRRLTARRQEAGWRFSTLYLIKDGFGVMLAAAGLSEDALREFYELEATYLEALAGGNAFGSSDFGASAPGSDTAILLSAKWRATRRGVLTSRGVAEFTFRQYLFACQARVLLQIGQSREVAERGLAFIRQFSEMLTVHQAAGQLPPLFKEAWTFSACVSIAQAASTEFVSRRQLPPQTAVRRSSGAVGLTGRAAASNAEAVVKTRLSTHSPKRPLDGPPLVPAMSVEPLRRQDSIDISAETAAAAATLDLHTPKALELNNSNFTALERRVSISNAGSRLHRVESPSGSCVGGGHHATGSGGTSSALASGRNSPAISDVSIGSGKQWETPPAPRVNWLLGSFEDVAGARTASDGTGLSRLEGTSLPLGRGTSSGPDVPLWRCLGRLFASARAELLRLGRGVHISSHVVADQMTDSLSPARPSAHDGRGDGIKAPRQPTSPSLLNPLPPYTQQASALGSGTQGGASSPDGRGTPSRLSRATSSAHPETRGPFGAGNMHGDDTDSVDNGAHRREDVERNLFAPLEGSHLILSPADSQPAVGQGGDSSPRVEHSDNSHDFHSRLSEAASAAVASAQSDEGQLASSDSRPSSPAKLGGDLSDPRLIEGEVETASESSTPRSPLPHDFDGQGGFAPSAPLHWLTEWRLKLALQDKDLFEELFIELSAAAAHCYEVCGRPRCAASMRSDIAAALAARGYASAAADLHRQQAVLLLREGWPRLVAPVLHKLAACQEEASSSAVAATYLAMLSLPRHAAPAMDRESLQAKLTDVCDNLRIGSSIGNLQGNDAEGSQGTGTHGVLQGCLIQGSSSRFHGDSFPAAAGGGAITLPPPQPTSSGRGGALQLSVGDVAPVKIRVFSNLPSPVQLQGLTLHLTLLQPTPVTVFEDRSIAKRLATGSRLSLPPHSRANSVMDGSASEQGVPAGGRNDLRRVSADTTAGGSSETGGADGDMTAEHTSLQWLPTEKLSCSPTGSDSAPQGGLTIQPGSTEVCFRACPVKAGLYVVQSLTARLGALKLALPVERPTGSLSLSASADSSSPVHISDDHGTTGSKQEMALLSVGPVRQRVAFVAVAQGGRLTAALEQWVGIVMAPLDDVIHQATIHVSVSPPPPGSALQPAVVDLDQTAVVMPLPPESVGPGWHSPPGLLRSCVPAASATAATASIQPPPPTATATEATEAIAEAATAKTATSAAATAPTATKIDSETAALIQVGGGPCSEEAAMQLLNGSGVLPPWTESQPCVMWMRMRAGEKAEGAETVRVTSASHRASSSGNRSFLPEGGTSPNEALAAAGSPLDLQVGLQYEDGCLRSHTCRLAIPIGQPFRVHIRAWEAGVDRVALQAVITNLCSVPVTLKAITAQLQSGFVVRTDLASSAGVLPLLLPPRQSTTAAFVLESESRSLRLPGQQQQRRISSSTLQLQYTAEEPLQGGTSVTEVVPTRFRPLLQGSTVLPLPPPSMLSDIQIDSPPVGRQHEQSSVAVFRHSFTLEVPKDESTSTGVIYVRLLGPFTATVGEQLTLCWQLQRGPASHSAAAEAVHFEVAAEGEGWHNPRGRCPGIVMLPGGPAATATVEALFLPTSAGNLPVPRLLLLDAAQQDSLDSGYSEDVILVADTRST